MRSYKFSEAQAEDIRGSAVYGVNDDKLGKVDDVIFDPGSGDIRYVVVDTGGWLSSKKFLVPADRLHASSQHEDDFEVNLTKSQIESFPPYDENAMQSQEDWGAYENRYRSSWPSGSAEHAGGRGRRWSAFEQRLRNDRERIVAYISPERERKVS
jgi:sporulation protein YlmC with PRC-barrel domain